MATWLPYHQHYKQGEHTVTGDVRVLPAFRSPQLASLGARHHEAAWARRLPATLRFLLTDRT